MRQWLLLIVTLGITTALYSQTSAYQDTDGNTSIYLRDPKANLTFNVSDTKFTVGYLATINEMRRDNLVNRAAKETDPAKQQVMQKQIDALNESMKNTKLGRSAIGVHFSGKPTTDLTGQILQSSSSPASVSGGLFYGIHRLGAKTLKVQDEDEKEHHPDHLRDDWFILNVNYSRSTFNTVANDSTTPVSQHFDGFDILPSYNRQVDIGAFTLIAGVSGGVNRTNNTGDLKKVEIDTTEATSGTVSVVSQKDAYLGAYKESIGVPIYSDFVFISKGLNWLSFDAFERANVVSTNGYAEGGAGVFIAKPDKPTEVLGGVSIGWKDGKSTIAIVAGWTF
jgi:hypothetical protein